jgi:dCTP deaminase
LLTEEIVTVPEAAIGFISVKSKFKLHGLVNVSGFHVDPGFHGRLIFSVHNAGGNDFRISRGDPLFLLWFADLSETTKEGIYDGPRQHQWSIPDSDIMALGRPQFSPSSMNDRLSQVESTLRTMSTILVGLFVAIVTATVLFLLR